MADRQNNSSPRKQWCSTTCPTPGAIPQTLARHTQRYQGCTAVSLHRRALAAAVCVATHAIGAAAAGKKPLFEYDDHYVMLNDYGRNAFYRRALERVVPACGQDCSVLDVGAGSGLLSMLAARLGAPNVLAIEANPSLASLATRTIQRNRPLGFPHSNVTVVAELSSRVDLEQMPYSRQADILVTETFGTMLLGEGAINFVPDARDRLLKPNGIVIPAGGCQYVTLVEIPDIASTVSPGSWQGLNLSRFDGLQDTVYWKASVGATNIPFKRLSPRICVLEVDLYKDTKESVPENRTFRIRATGSGVVHAALFDWDIWADSSKEDILSTAPGSRNFAGDVAWGWLLQMQEEANQEDWRFGSWPHRLKVDEGDELEMGVEFIARGISMHVRVRKAPQPEGTPEETKLLAVGSPSRMRGIPRGDMIEANEYFLPLAGDHERHEFYDAALRDALRRNATSNHNPTVLDCSGGGGVPALLAAKQHGLHSLVLTQRNEYARVLRKIAEDNGVEDLVESYAADARDLLESLLPKGERTDIVVLEPPGTPMHGLSPFALLPSIRKHLLKERGTVVPAGACFEVGLVESEELAHMFSVPHGSWGEIDFSVWNEEARRQGILERLVPYTKWLGSQSTLHWKWLTQPSCIFDVDFNVYGKVETAPEEAIIKELEVMHAGESHALVARWKAWALPANDGPQLSAASPYYGRSLTWPSYVQALAVPGTEPGVLKPVSVLSGDVKKLQVTIRQGSGKITGSAGPEFALRLLPDGADRPGVEL